MPVNIAERVAWRPELERAVLNASDVLDSVVIRPALVYGGSSHVMSKWLEPIANATSTATEIHIAASPDVRPALVHIDDVVSAIHLVAVKHALVSTASGNYPIFDIFSSSELMKPILKGTAQVLGCKAKLVFDGPGEDLWAQALNTSQKGSSTRLRGLLGWVPKHSGFGADVAMYVNAWKSYQQG
jgi:nucleoside-diphosphate-sugar epimerase